jgi:hypothetical protein
VVRACSCLRSRPTRRQAAPEGGPSQANCCLMAMMMMMMMMMMKMMMMNLFVCKSGTPTGRSVN